MTYSAVSFTNVKDIRQKYIAVCGGSSGKIVVWKMKHSWYDLPSASVCYEGKIVDIKTL